MSKLFPYFTHGKVIAGFGRGSKELGCPTANFPDEIVESLPEQFSAGIYYGWASVDDGDIHKMVMSIGWNPYYKNTKKTMETHIIHVFEEDFYGADLKVCLSGYIRPEKNFDTLEELIACIHSDIDMAKNELEKAECAEHRQNEFFKSPQPDFRE